MEEKMQDNYKFGFFGATTSGGSECYNFVLFIYRIKLNSNKLYYQFVNKQIHNKTYFNIGTN